MWCLTGNLADKFLGMIRGGSINPESLMNMTSAERHTFFAQHFGEVNAKSINASFEGKLLLKNQQQGIVNWAKRMGGLKPEIQRDILSRVRRMDKVLEPNELTGFLSDLAEQKLGIGVTFEEATRITELAKDVYGKKAGITDAMPDGSPERLNYGASRWTFDKYVGELKTKATRKRLGEYLTHPISTFSDIGGFAKALKATLDNSYQFRQGIKVFVSHPVIWSRNFAKSFKLISRELRGGKDVMGGVMADIYSRQNAINRNYSRWKLDLGINEEQFPTTAPEKIPLFGRVYKAAETAYTATARKTRADLADYYFDVAQKSGTDIISNQADALSFGKFVNALTGRGYMGKGERIGKFTNNVFFSIRNLKSNWDFLTAHQLQKDVSPFVRKQAAINLLKYTGGMAAILTVANAVKPGSVETDPRSVDFGKIKLGDTRFDVTGGMGGIVTLAFRMARMSTKSSTTGRVTPLNTGKFGAPTVKDQVYNFFENKFAPATSLLRDLAKGETYGGGKLTLQGEAYNFLTPMMVTDFVELQNNPNAPNIILAMIANGLGFGVNTYMGKPKTESKKQKGSHWTDFIK